MTTAAGRISGHPPLTLEAFGDSALMVSIEDPDTQVRRTAIGSVRTAVLKHLPYGVRDVIAGLESLLVEFDPLLVNQHHLQEMLPLLLEAHRDQGEDQPASPPREFIVPMDTRPEFAPDLHDIAQEQGMTAERVLEAFTSSTMTINLLAAAMAPMMEGVELPAPVSRCALPRTDVPAGAVMVAGHNALIQPFPGPSGWKIIGRTPLSICDIHRAEPTSYRPGDLVRFVLLPQEDWNRLDGGFLMPLGGDLS
jgi:KipI family sensor histidine kinase inhibitor